VALVKKINMKIIKATDITEQPSDKLTKTLHGCKINTNKYLIVGEGHR
jgi:hypothetical protein